MASPRLATMSGLFNKRILININWRGRVAKIHLYFEQGQALLASVRNLLVIGAALKIFGLSTWWLVALTPPILIGHVVVGWLWVRWGWLVQRGEVPLWDKWAPIQVWDRWMQVRMLRALGVEMNDYERHTLPEEVQRVLASSRKEAKE